VKGSESELRTRTLLNTAKVFLDPSVILPSFCAVNLNRLPPVDADHVDVSAILAKVFALRQEIRWMSQLREELSALKVQVQAASELRDEVLALRSMLQGGTVSDSKFSRTLVDIAVDADKSGGTTVCELTTVFR